MDTSIFIIMGGVVVAFLSILVYAGLAIFYPEWVGITGKVALNAEQSHNINHDQEKDPKLGVFDHL